MSSQTPLSINCPPECSFHPDKIGKGAASALRAVRENGAGQNVFSRRAAELLGHPVPSSNVQRHLKHYREIDDGQSTELTGKTAGDLEILNKIIQKGFENSGSWKPSIKDTMEAMKLKAQLTGNSAFQDMLDQMEKGLTLMDDESEAPENPEAVGTPDEVAPEEEPLGEVVL